MDSAVVAETARQILHSEPPKRVIKLAESLCLQSSTSIPLKPNVEPARVYVCCVLAVEKLGSQLDLPGPDTQKPPVPPHAYVRLLDQFRHTLLGMSPPKQSNGDAVAGLGSRHRTRAVRRKSPFASRARGSGELEVPDVSSEAPNAPEGLSHMNESHVDPNAAEDISDDGDDYNDDVEGGDFGSARRSPQKRASGASSKGASTPTKTSPRKRAKSAAPTSHAVDQIGGLMGLASETTDAVRHAFEQYCDLVKDSWGLVYGLFAVISERAEPRMGMENLNRLDRALREVAPPRLYVDPNEWIPWVERIVTGQTWIMKISKRPEPAAKLVGAPGGWGLGVEYTLVDP